MNLRTAYCLIGLLLATFWVFGWMLALDRVKVDESHVMPSLKAATQFEIDEVVVSRAPKGKEPEEHRFVRAGDHWNLAVGEQNLRVEAFRVRDLIKEIRDARRDEDAAVALSPADAGLEPPLATVVLRGARKAKKDPDAKDAKDAPAGEKREWKLFLGNDSVDKKYVYVATSDRPQKTFAVPRTDLAAAFFKSVTELRAKRLFEFSEPNVRSFALRQGKDAFEATRTDAGAWTIEKPALGAADVEGPKEGAKTPGGILGLLDAVANVRVDVDADFVPAAPGNAKRFGLDAGQETGAIVVRSGDAGKTTEETLLLGATEGAYRYARLAGDDGIVKLKTQSLAPIAAAIADPAKLRNVDFAPLAIAGADALTIVRGAEEARFFQAEAIKGWTVELGKDTRTPTKAKAVETLLDVLQGRRQALAFRDAADPKADAEAGFDAPVATVTLYLKGLADPSKTSGGLKKDAKADVAWLFGKTIGDRTLVKRTLANGAVARFEAPKELLEKVLPREGLLAYLEPFFPARSPIDVERVELERNGKRLTLAKRGETWTLQEEGSDAIPADRAKTNDLVNTLSKLQAQRWVTRLGPKDDLAAYGLAAPTSRATLVSKRSAPRAQTLAEAIAPLANLHAGLAGVGAACARLVADSEERTTFTFGKDDEGGAVFVRHSDIDRLATTPKPFADLVAKSDLRDRSHLLNPQVLLAGVAVGSASPAWCASPLVTGHLGRDGAASVRELKVSLRTAFEVREFRFIRKDKAWVEQSGLREFDVDPARVDDLAAWTASGRVDRFVKLSGGPAPTHGLAAKDALVVAEATLDGGRTATLTIGADFEGRGHFAQSSLWPDVVSFAKPEAVRDLLRGVAHFGKDRKVAADR